MHGLANFKSSTLFSKLECAHKFIMDLRHHWSLMDITFIYPYIQ